MAVTKMKYADWVKLMEEGDPETTKSINGTSPGGASAVLGISRQAVMKAINDGRLDAVKVPAPDWQRPSGCYWFITDDAIERFQAERQSNAYSRRYLAS